MSAATIAQDIKNQMRDLKEKTEQFKAKYSPRSRDPSPVKNPHSAILEQSMVASPDVSYQIFQDVKSPNPDRMSGLQESLTENKARLSAILGVGMALDKAYRRSTTPEPHVRFSRSTSDADKKDSRVVFDQLSSDNNQLNSQLIEKSRELTAKTRDADKLSADLQRVTSLLAAKNNNLTVLETHVNAVETLINSLVSTESGKPSSKPGTPGISGFDSDLVSPHSNRFSAMISNLSYLKSSSVRCIEDLNTALKTIDELKSELRHKQIEFNKLQTGNTSKAADDVKVIKAQLDREVERNRILQAEHRKEVESLEAELLESISKLNESNSNLVELYALLGDAESGTEKLQEQLASCGAAAAALNKDKEALLAAQQKQQQLLQSPQQNSNNGKHEVTLNALNQAQRELLELKNKLSQLQEELKHSEDIISVQQSDIRALSQREGTAAAALAAVQEDSSALHQQCAVLEASVAAKEAELSDLATQNAILEARITELSRQLKNANSELAASQQQQMPKSPDVSNKDKLISNLQIALDGNRKELSDVMTQNAALEASLAAMNKKLQAAVADSSYDNKNSEKLIQSLESTLETNKRELASVLSQNAALENKLAEMHKLVANEKRSPMKRIDSEESMSLRKELFSKAQEIAELRDRNTELTLSNGTYLEKLMATENELNGEIERLHDRIAAMNTEHESALEDLRRQLAQWNQQYYSSTARDAEKKVTFSLGAVRTHLKQNGVKFFLWEDFAALLKKVEELHNRPNQPIVCLAELLDVEDEDEGYAEEGGLSGGNSPIAGAGASGSAVGAAGGLERKKSASASTLKSALSKKTLLVKGASPGSEHSDVSFPSPTSRESQPQVKTPLSVHKPSFRLQSSTESSAARSVTGSSANADPSKKWNSGKVDKADPFGDGKNKNPIKAKNSHKEMLERMDSMKVGAGGTGSGKGIPTMVGKKTATTPGRKTTTSGGVKSGATTPVVKVGANGGAASDEETVQEFDEEKDVF